MSTRSYPWRRRALTGLAVALAATTACSSSGRAHPSGTGSSGPTTTTAPFAVPSQTALKSGLLTLGEAGAPFTTDDSGGSSGPAKVSGCDALNNALANGAGDGVVHAEADYDGGSTGPLLSEQLVSEPESRFNADQASTANALQTCRSVILTSSGTAVRFTMAPDPTFAGADLISGTVDGTKFTGDLVERKVGPAALFLLEIQARGAPTTDIPSLWAKALQKAQAALGG